MAKGKAKAAKAAARFKKTKSDARSEQEAPEEQLASADPAQHLNATQQAVVGLTNLGNTCFFNSSVQLLLACAPLQQMLQQKEHDITRGPLGFALQQAVLHAAGRSSSGKPGSASTYNPQSLLSAVCCHAPVFKGKQQHDAHELMRVLLDGLQTQEQRYRELARKAASKGSTALANGTSELTNVHCSTQNGHPDLSTTSSSSSSSSDSPQAEASERHLAEDAHAADSPAASSARISDSSNEDNTGAAAADGDGLADLCRAYLAKPAPATLSSLDDTPDTVKAADSPSESGADTPEAPSSVASSTEAVGSASSSTSSPATEQQHPGQTSEGAQGDQLPAMQEVCSTAHANGQQQELANSLNGVVGPAQPTHPTSTCSACGCALPQRQQQQQQPPTLQRKSLLPPEPPKSTGPSSVEAVFGGVLSSCITCTACGYRSISYEPFLDLSLPIPLGKGPEEGGLARKGSLLSRLAGRANGKKKAAAQESSADSKTAAAEDAAAATAAAEAAATAAADAAAAADASNSNKKANHKDKRRLQQAAAKAAKEAAKLARLAKKKQQEQEDVSGSSSSSRGDAQQAAPAAAAVDPTMFEDVPATNYYTAEQISLKQSVLGSPAGQQQQQEDDRAWNAALEEHHQRQQQQDDQAQQQQQQQQQDRQQRQQEPAENGSLAVSEGSSLSGGSPAGGTRRVTASDDGTSPIGAWTGVSIEDASPPTAGVSCWGGGWADMRSPPPASSANGSSHAQAPHSSSSGFPPSLSDVSTHPADSSEASGSSTKPSTGLQQTPSTNPRVTLHRRFGSLGSLSTLTSGAKGGLSNLFSGRHSRQGSRDKDSLDKLAAALAASSSGNGAGVGTQVSRPGSAGGATSPSTGRGGGIKGFLLNRSPTPPPPRPSFALRVVSEAAEGGVDGTAVDNGTTANGTSPELAVRSTSSSIPEGYAVDPADFQQQQGGPQALFSPLGVLDTASGGLSVCATGPSMGQSTAAAVIRAASDSNTAGSQAGMQQQQQQPQVPIVRKLQRAFSDDAVVRLGSVTRSSSNSSSSNGGDRQQQQQQQQQQPEGVGTVTPLLDSTAGAAAAAVVANSSASTHTEGYENPFGTPAVQQQQQANDALPLQQQQQQQQPSAGVTVPGTVTAPGTDPFAAAAVVTKGEGLAVKHCLATFFLREEVCWECPKEKALWRERRISAAGSAGSASGRVSLDGRANRVSVDSGAKRVSFEGSSSAAGSAGVQPLCAACRDSKQQEAEGGGGVAIVAAHPRLQQLLEGAEEEDSAVFKQVSFSDRQPQVHLVPGSVEQRGTDLSAALAGHKPFCRALTWGGASLLLTAQLGEAFLEGAAAGRQLKLGMKAAGEGGVANTQAARVLPGGQMLLGVVKLPDVQGLGLSGDDSAVLLQHWAQLVLNCMADLVHCEEGITGLQSMVAGGLTLSSLDGSQPALRPGYVDSASLEGLWKIVGHLPPTSAGGASQQQQQEQKPQLGYWEYPAGDVAPEEADIAAAAADSPQLATPAGAGDSSGPSSNGVGVHGGSLSSSAGQSPVSVSAAASPAAAGSSPESPGYAAADTSTAGSSPTQPRANGLANGAGAGECGDDNDMFAMDDDDEGGVGSAQQEQGPHGLPPQGWQGDALSSASSSNLGGRGSTALRSGSSWGSGDATTGEGSASTGRSVSLFRKVPVSPSGSAAAGAAAGTAVAAAANTAAAAVQLGCGPAADGVVDNGVLANGGSSSKATDVPAEQASGAAAAAVEAGSSRPMHITKPLQGSPPSDVSGAGVFGLSPPVVGSAGSGRQLYGSSPRRSSMRRRSSSSSRTAHKSYRIYLPPQVLLLHLKRFQHDGKGRLNKLDTAVKFEFELDLSPFMAENAPQGSGDAGVVSQGAGNGDTAVSSSEQEQQQQQQQQQSLMYDLVGLVVHMGTMRGGHYIAYVKRVHGDATEQGPAGSSSSSGGKGGGRVQWYYISDTTVRAVGVAEVAAAQAYMLLYARRPVEVGQQDGQQQVSEHDCGL